MSELKFYLKGAFDGDGHYNAQNFIQINVIDYDFLEEIKMVIKKEFNKEVKISPHTKAIGKSKAQFRINFYLGGKEEIEKFRVKIPSSREERIQYLKGLWDAEGSVGMCDKRIIRKGVTYIGKDKWLTLSQKDQKRLDSWHSYMQELGIESMKTYRQDGRSFLSIRRNDSIRKFNELIGFRIKRKQDRLNELINYLCQEKLLEIDKAKIVSIYTQTNFGCEYISKMFGRSKNSILALLKYRNVDTKKYRQRKINHDDIDIAEGILGRDLPFELYQSKIETFSIKNLKTSKIKSIKFHSRTKGVDLSTEKYHNFFLSNGVLSHNSRKAFQVASFIAWMLAGGNIDMELVDYGSKKTWKINKITNPKTPPTFNLHDNVVFNAADLQSRAHELYKKYGKNQIIVYDEGREGLDAKRAMENLNKVMEDFFQECGFMGHVILIVLPNFFKLHEDYAVSRSLFLIDCFANKKKKRGFYNFYDERQKEWLYFLGKKRIGISMKYDAASETFWGRFSSWFPFDETEYNKLKEDALKKRRRTTRQLNWKKQRDALVYLYKINTEKSNAKIAEEVTVASGFRISDDIIDKIIKNVTGTYTDTR